MSSTVFGRRDELALGTRLLDELPRASAVLVVVGEAGIGKSCLVDVVERAAQDRRLRVLRGGCAPLGASVPYAPLRNVLQGQDAFRGNSQELVGAAGRAGWFDRLDTTLACSPGTVLIVEDAHWADHSSLVYLAHLARNLPPAGLLLLVTYRDEDADAAHDDWLAEQVRLPQASTMRLEPLTPEESVQQVQALSPGTPESAALAVHARSGGNPYLTAELALSARDGALSASLRQVLMARIRAAGAGPLLVVSAAGLLTRPATDHELLAAADGDEQAVRAAYQKHLVVAARDGPAGALPRHPVLAESAYLHLLPEQRRLLHGRLAQALETGQAAGRRAAEIAEHHMMAGHPDDALTWSVRAAEAAAGQFAYAEAGHWYATAVAAWPSATVAAALVPPLADLADSGARALAIAGRHVEVVELVDRVLDAGPMSSAAVPLLLRRSWSRFVTADTTGALADVDRALAAPGLEHAPALAAQVYALLAHLHGTCSRWPEAVTAARKAQCLAARSGNVRADGLAATVLGVAALLEGQLHNGLAELERALSLGKDLGEPDDLALAGVCLASYYSTDGPAERAVTVIESVRADLRRLAPQGHWLDDMLASNEAHALMAVGEWDRAIAVADDARGDLGFAQVEIAQIEVARGDLTSARERLRRAETLDRLDQPQFHLSVAIARAALELTEGRPQRALAQSLGTAELVSGTDLESVALPLLLTGIRAAALIGASAEIDRLLALLPGALDGPTGPAVRAQAAGERSGATGTPDPASWVSAAAEWEAVRRPYDQARALVRAAESLLATRGHRREAAAALRTAFGLAARLGAVPLQTEVTDLARAARLPIPRAPEQLEVPKTIASESVFGGLTEREEQVLVLVADGRTNREIGESLYMSPKTASVHVTRILQKLGVRTRVEAAALAVRHGLTDDVGS
jgi:DNA-binding CsgD family transcriptional regulator/tetratricopeptide (TPR) repeat protein